MAHTNEPDLLLQMLNNTVQDTTINTEIGITLSVNGSTISGLLIGATQYLKITADSLYHPDNQPEVQRLFGGLFQTWHDQELDFINDNSENKRYIDYDMVHVKNARIYPSDSHSNLKEGILWRGKLNSVDGFSLGLIQ